MDKGWIDTDPTYPEPSCQSGKLGKGRSFDMKVPRIAGQMLGVFAAPSNESLCRRVRNPLCKTNSGFGLPKSRKYCCWANSRLIKLMLMACI